MRLSFHLFAEVSSFSENLSLVQSLSLISGDWTDSPWPLSLFLLKLMGIAGSKILLLGISLILWLVYLYNVSPVRERGLKLFGPFLFLPLCLGRDLVKGTIANISDPYFSLLLWVGFFALLSLLRNRNSLPHAYAVGVWLFLWPWFDVSWTLAYAIGLLTLLGLSGPRKWISLCVVCAGAGGSMMLRNQSLPEFNIFLQAILSDSESGVRYVSGMISPNFQVRRELLFALALIASSGRRETFSEVIACLGVVSAAFLGELGVIPLCVFAADALRRIFQRDYPASLFEIPIFRGLVAVLLVILPVLLINSRKEPFNYQYAARSAFSRLPMEKRQLTVIEDFRVSNSVLQLGGRPFLDMREPKSILERAGDYARILKLDEGYQSLLEKYNIQAILVPADAPIANLSRERGGWREVLRGKAVSMLNRGVLRETPFAFFERLKATEQLPLIGENSVATSGQND